MLFNSRSASSLFEADIGVAVCEIMGIINKVKHRPQGQCFSQRADEKKAKRKQAYSVVRSSTSLHFLQTELKRQPKTSVVWTDVYLFKSLKRLSAGSAAGTVGECPARHTQSAPPPPFPRAGYRKSRREAVLAERVMCSKHVVPDGAAV